MRAGRLIRNIRKAVQPAFCAFGLHEWNISDISGLLIGDGHPSRWRKVGTCTLWRCWCCDKAGGEPKFVFASNRAQRRYMQAIRWKKMTGKKLNEFEAMALRQGIRERRKIDDFLLKPMRRR